MPASTPVEFADALCDPRIRVCDATLVQVCDGDLPFALRRTYRFSLAFWPFGVFAASRDTRSTMHSRPALAATVAATVLAACGSATDASNTVATPPPRVVTRAAVPGIGEVVGYVRPGTHVRAPARVPRTKLVTESELNREMTLHERLARDVQPSPDRGAPAEIARVRRDVADDLFLDQAAVGCDRSPRASFAVFAFIWAPPSRRPELDNLRAGQPARDVRQSCRRFRLRIGRWQGIRIRGNRATAMLTGYREWREGRRWRATSPPGRTVSRMALLSLHGRWRLAVEEEEYPDDTED